MSAIIAEVTPGIDFTASSTCFRTGSQALTAPASTLIEKNTLPSLITMSDTAPLSVSLAAIGGCDRRKAFENLIFGGRHVRNLPARFSGFVAPR